MSRRLSIQSPIQAGSWDDLLLYYHYQKSVRHSGLSPSSDPMLKFKTPLEVGMPLLIRNKYEIFEWSLGGFSGLNPLHPQVPDFREWVNSYIQYDYGDAPARFYGVIRQEPALPVNLPRFFEREKELTYRKILNNSAIREYLNNVPLISAPENRAEGQVYNWGTYRHLFDPRINQFIRTAIEEALRLSQPYDFSSFDILGIGSLNDTSFTSTESLFDAINPMLEGMGENRNDDEPRTLAAGALFKGLLEILPMQTMLRLLAGSGEYQNPTNNLQWSYYRTQQVTPFVSSADSREYLSENQLSYKRASVSVNYNLYRSAYERAVATPGVSETYIPNGYAYYILNNSIPDPDINDKRIPPDLEVSDQFPGVDAAMRVPSRIRESARNSTTVAENTLTLDGETPPDTLQGETAGAYYKEYASNLADTTSTAPEVTETIIFPATDSDLLNTVKNRQYLFPFSTSVEFWRDSAENRSAEIVYENLRSVSMLAGISGSSSTSSAVLLNSENLTNRDTGLVTSGFVPPRTQDLNFYDLTTVANFSAPPNSQVIKPLVLTEKCLEGSTGFPAHPWFIPSENSMLGELYSYANTVAKTYSEITDLSFMEGSLDSNIRTVSEAIGYKLVKRQFDPVGEEEDSPASMTLEPGPIIQNIMFGNTPRVDDNPASSESQITNYIDTQVKYGEYYGYSLHEYRLVYSTAYEFFMFAQDVPDGLEGNDTAAIESLANSPRNEVPVINYRCYVLRRPKIELVEIPIYDRGTYINPAMGETLASPRYGAQVGTPLGISYPPVQILDTPPPPPDLNVLPLKGNTNQIKLIMTPSAGSYEGEHALPLVVVPHSGTFWTGAISPLDILTNQYEYDNPPPQPQRIQGERGPVPALNYKSEGVKEIKAIKIYRSTEINSLAPSIRRVYASFDPVKNVQTVSTITLVNTLYHPNEDINFDLGEVGVVSYDMIDTIEPNVFYYYTCVALDVHDNPSPPSQIYRVRLVLDKGLLVPEVEIYEHTPPPITTSTRKFSRFVQVEASPIQANPFSERNQEGQITSIRSLASERRQTSVTDNKFILRITSKDTGRKFDLELDFFNRDTPIADEEE